MFDLFDAVAILISGVVVGLVVATNNTENSSKGANLFSEDWEASEPSKATPETRILQTLQNIEGHPVTYSEIVGMTPPLNESEIEKTIKRLEQEGKVTVQHKSRSRNTYKVIKDTTLSA